MTSCAAHRIAVVVVYMCTGGDVLIAFEQNSDYAGRREKW